MIKSANMYIFSESTHLCGSFELYYGTVRSFLSTDNHFEFLVFQIFSQNSSFFQDLKSWKNQEFCENIWKDKNSKLSSVLKNDRTVPSYSSKELHSSVLSENIYMLALLIISFWYISKKARGGSFLYRKDPPLEP